MIIVLSVRWLQNDRRVSRRCKLSPASECKVRPYDQSRSCSETQLPDPGSDLFITETPAVDNKP